jgi:Protein of unknown function (DUF3040)
VVRRDDPRFADGLRAGRPVAPWEYRERDGRQILVVAAVADVVMLVIGWDTVALGTGIVILGWRIWRR